MKIAIVSPYITSNVPREYYSSQQLNLAKSIVKHGHKVHIFTLNLNSLHKYEEMLDEELLKIVYLPSITKILEKLGFPLLKKLLNEIKNEQYDILLISGDYHPTAIQVILSNLSGKKVIFHGVNSYSRNNKKRIMMKVHDKLIVPLFRNRTDLVITKTSEGKDFIKNLGYKNVVHLPVGYGPSRFYPRSREDVCGLKEELGIKTDNIILYIGNLIPRRQVSLQIKAFAEVARTIKDLQFIIIGKGIEKKRLIEMAKKLGIIAKIIFIDKVPNEKLSIFYTAARCFLFTPLYEIFGMVLPEALGCGCPVISTPIPAAKDILNKTNSIIVPFNDYFKLADAIEKVLTEKIMFDVETVVKSVEQLKWNNLAKDYLVEFSKLL